MIYLYLFLYLVIGWIGYLLMCDSPEYQNGLEDINNQYPNISIRALDIISFILTMIFWPLLIVLGIISTVWTGLSN